MEKEKIDNYLLDNGFKVDMFGYYSKEINQHEIFIDNDRITVYIKGERDHPLLNNWKFDNITDIYRILKLFKIDTVLKEDFIGSDSGCKHERSFSDIFVNGSTAKWVVDIKGSQNERSQEISIVRDDFEHGKKSYGWFLGGLKILVYSTGSSMFESNPPLDENEWLHQINIAINKANEMNKEM